MFFRLMRPLWNRRENPSPQVEENAIYLLFVYYSLSIYYSFTQQIDF